MVFINDYKKHLTEDGRDFFVLVVQGGLEMVKSKETGKYYATIRQATVPSTFDEATCKTLLGTQLGGSIEKAETDPYEYTIKDTGEVITLTHKWEYNPDGVKARVEKSTSTIDDFMMSQQQEKFSMNGAEV